MYKNNFKNSLLALSIAASFAATANETETQLNEKDEDPEIEVIEVTGIKGSLLRSMDLKREAKGIVDGISAVDIGKFPDTNLAESLQRVTGIAIERDRGEGSKITVRGFGPDFNLVTFNERQMPTTGGRSFDFGNIASEAISAVEVYKSGRANVPTGGIGAVVNVKTAKPLNKPGAQAAFSAKAVHDPGTREGKEVTPEFAAIMSNSFFDDTFGVGLSFSYQERDGGWQSATTQDMMSRNFVSQEAIEAYELANPGMSHPDNEWGTILVGDPNAVNFPTEIVDGIYAVPTNIQYNLDDFHRERVNTQLTLQWKPFDTLIATMDYTYAQNQMNTEHKDVSAWFDPGCNKRDSEWIQEGNIYSPVYYSVNCSADRIQGVGRFATVDENNSLGFNVKWDVTEDFSMKLDYHDSYGESKPNSKWGSSGFMAVASQDRVKAEAFFSKDGMPIMNIQQGETNSFGQTVSTHGLDLNNMQLSGSGFGSFHNRMDVKQIQLDTTYMFDEGHSIEIGAANVKVTNRGQSAWVARNAWSGVGEPGDIADLLYIETLDGVFDGIKGSGDPRQTTEFVSWNHEALITRAEEMLQAGLHGNVVGDGGPCLTGFCPTYDFDLDEVTTEESNSFYIQGHYVAEIFNMDANFYVGLRYEDTSVHSAALVPLYDRIEWDVASNNFDLYKQIDDNGQTIVGFSEIEGDYDMWLPSLDFDIELVDDVILRGAYSLTVTRPVYNDLKGALIIHYMGSEGGFGQRGNPQLLPMESENFDLSLEWYYDEASYMSLGLWRKKVDNFIVSAVFEDQPLFSDLRTPIEGDLYNQAIADITGGDPFFEYEPSDVLQYFADNFADHPNVEVTGEGEDLEVVVTGNDSDPVATFDVSIPINQRKTNVEGLEVAFQHAFGETGFGFQANFTIVEGNLNYDINLNEEQWVVPGMSNTANLVVFYENDFFESRIAYNWRDKYLQSAGRDPRFVEEYYQIDASASVKLGENFSIFIEAINLTEEDQRIHGRSSYQVREYSVGHSRYNLGARYVF
ncbi:TonB-dependent receptor [Thalassotalea litorea]|uniref:TonB-dependent receptor n=1 Tax=Thalassotalea litorea TaxID=2020715 RepID=UPI003735D57F